MTSTGYGDIHATNNLEKGSILPLVPAVVIMIFCLVYPPRKYLLKVADRNINVLNALDNGIC